MAIPRRSTVHTIEDSHSGQPARIRWMSDGNLIIDVPITGQRWQVGYFQSGNTGGTQVQLYRTDVESNPADAER